MPKAGTYSTRRIAVPDYDVIKRTAEQAVKDQLGALARPDDRVERAAEIIRQADAEIALHVDDRNAATASLWFYEHTLGLARALGVNKNAYREILAKALTGDPKGELPGDLDAEGLAKVATAAGVPRIEDAGDKLPELARIVAAARARRTAAVPFMQDAALALSEEPYSWDGERIAAHANVAVKLIWQHWAAARRRREH
ncbi:hypothetical protein ACIP9H_34015 [Streptomyces sp. NPDC088732]|uniref:hypothetical protein n=1 Tax=Streptomyces sp. NPDC088732 TaxID=3365879 RepID=UPI0037FA8D43